MYMYHPYMCSYTHSKCILYSAPLQYYIMAQCANLCNSIWLLECTEVIALYQPLCACTYLYIYTKCVLGLVN